MRELREQLQRSQELAQSLQQQLQQQAQAGGRQPGSQSGQGNPQGGRQQVGGARGTYENRIGGSGEIRTDGNNLPWGNARSIRQQLTQQDIEEFLNQHSSLKKQITKIQAELDNINNKLFATADEDIPDEYRELVENYYRVLSENPGTADQAQ